MSGQKQQLTQRTFEYGTLWPPLKEDTLRLYSMRFCPYAQRARLVLAHKNVPYETVNVHLKRKPSWLLERNPKGRVPVLEHPDGRLVFESIVVCQYLDEIYPQNQLGPADPYRKARDRLMVDFCEKFMMASYQMLFSDGTSEEARDTFLKGFSFYDQELQKRLPDGPFFGGRQPVMVDYLIWPWFERLPMVDDSMLTTNNTSTTTTTDARKIPTSITSSKFPQLYRWMKAMYTLPAVQETMFDLQSHSRFGRTQLTADPDYDMGLENEPPLPTAARL